MASPSGTFDFIIVGGGTAGLVLATRFSESPALGRVLVIEAGEDLTEDPRVNIPAMGAALMANSANWALAAVVQTGLKGRTASVPQGRMLGGSSAFNGFAFMPPSKSTVDMWAKLGNQGWDWSSFSKSMAQAYSAGAQGQGPIQLSIPNEEDWKWPAAWRDTLAGLGYPTTSNPYDNSGSCFGAILVGDSIDPDTKQRSYAGNAYYGQAKSRDSLTVWVGITIEKILFNKNKDNHGRVRAIGVQYKDENGQTKTVTADKEVILAAGAINSPKLLELSGIGDEAQLRLLQIPDIVVHNPFVGENLQNHVMCSLCFEVRPTKDRGYETTDSIIRQEPAALSAAMEAYGRQTGPLARSGTNAIALLPLPGIESEQGKQEILQILEKTVTLPGASAGDGKSRPFLKEQEDFVHRILSSPHEPSGHYITFSGFAVVAADGSIAGPPPGDERYYTIAPSLSHPLSRGSVHVSSASASSAPTIDPNYLSHPLDIEVLARHFQFAASRIASTEPLASHLTRKLGTSSDTTLDDFIHLDKTKEYLRNNATGAVHYVGSCSMMPRELGGVVDSKLRVYGCSNLRVCDASIVPIIPSCNIQATVYGVAEHGASLIMSDYI
ncbi:hypothetical protein M406DRAFT_53264 [Cryphonectria parasitica EP155]|uniref:Glucose-methanol-choline oxidoreductase N-terminal domain-containing protein n=1 Tax=Cryphonectria parasitica (strain ATCC 38755 / EP155) TaxID=660469 RepID=A0A9P5CR22_CRYP1|nr:uncharacterized protein M406DRAFT_53264 [Cryphonectria parasitica EP155]KAF3766670.1 hypothetical protein M406DRAFT_53264 [Cryphonectria parasitica EP155]